MDMKKICCIVVVVAATISSVLAVTPITGEMATGGLATSPAPDAAVSTGAASGPDAASGTVGAAAPGPATSGAAQTMQIFGSFVGASLMSFLTYYLQY